MQPGASADDFPQDVLEVMHYFAPPPAGVRVHYAKHMSHHLAMDEDLGWTLGFRNLLLVDVTLRLQPGLQALRSAPNA